MARIVHVSNFGFKPKGVFQHGVAPKLSNGLIRNGHSVMNFSDRDMARWSNLLGHRKFGVRGANETLVTFCLATEPDLLLLGHADVIRPETIARIRARLPKTRVVQWNVDGIFLNDTVQRILSKSDVVDATLVSTTGPLMEQLRRPGRLLGFIPNPVDFSIESGTNHLRDSLPYDLFFAAGGFAFRQVCGREWKPDALIRMLMAEIPGLRVKAAAFLGEPVLLGARYQAAIESAAIGLNVSRRNDIPLYTSDRLAHMIGNGQAVLMERTTGYGSLFGEDEIAFFSTIEELIGQIRRLVDDPAHRRAVATAGRQRYHTLFNEQIVARYVFDVAFAPDKASAYPWPTLI